MEKCTIEEMGRRYPSLAPTVNITFKQSGIAGLQRLYVLERGGFLKFKDEILVLAIVQSSDWGSDQNRVVRARLINTGIWHEHMFTSQIARDIEIIRLATKHPLNALMTRRKKRQETIAFEIIEKCLGNLNIKELPDFELNLYGILDTVNGLPQLSFTLVEDVIHNEVATIVLDGWSGQIIVNGMPQKAYSDPKEFQEIILDIAFKHLEKITTPS